MPDNVVKQNLEADMADPNELVNYELVLVNILLHAFYQFVLLRSVSESLALQGSSWMTENKDDKCRDSAVKTLSWIQQNNGYLELADISKPTFYQDTLDGEFIFARWDEVEEWVEDKACPYQGENPPISLWKEDRSDQDAWKTCVPGLVEWVHIIRECMKSPSLTK